MKVQFLVLLPLISMAGCQLPHRGDVSPDLPSNFDGATIIPSNNGLLSEGLSKVPGSICVADDLTGRCNPEKLVPFQCIVKGTTVEIKPVTEPNPTYHSIITNAYTSSTNTPFISAPSAAEYVDEVKASISATASLKSGAVDDGNGYPGIDGIKACLLRAYGPKNYKKVIWIQAANIISVTTSRFSKVSNSLAVTGTAFGFNGATFNSSNVGKQTIWIGIFGNVIDDLGSVSTPIIAGSNAKVISSSDNTIIVETAVPISTPTPEAVPLVEPSEVP